MSETTNVELTKAAAEAVALKENQEREALAAKVAAEAQETAGSVDPLSAEADESQDAVPDVVVELDPDFDAGVSTVSVAVANFPDLVLEAGQTYAVSPKHAELLLSSPAVQVAE